MKMYAVVTSKTLSQSDSGQVHLLLCSNHRQSDRMRKSSQHTDRLWVLNEDLRLAELVLICVHVDGTHEMVDSLLHFTLPLRPSFRRQNCIPLHRDIKVLHFNLTFNSASACYS